MSAYGEDEGTVLEMEEEIMEELEDVVGKLSELSAKEEEFLKKIENADSSNPRALENKLEENITSIKISLEDDITAELKDIETKIKSLRDTVSQQNGPHIQIIEPLSNALGMLEKEEQRFDKLLKKSEEHLEQTDDIKGTAHKILEFEETEEQETVRKIKNEITTAEHRYEEYLKKAA